AAALLGREAVVGRVGDLVRRRSGAPDPAGVSPLVTMYRRLDGARIVETLERLRQRVEERFPGSGLEHVSRDLLSAASESMARLRDLRRPNVLLRIATGALIAIIVFVAVEALLHLRLAPRWEEFATFLQSSQAIQNVVFLGLAVLFLATVETRIKRRRALAALHELRSIAHIVDMHQLTKDPDQLLGEGGTTATSSQRIMTRFALSRYLDSCSELLSLTSKVAALYVQDSQDPVLLVGEAALLEAPVLLRYAAGFFLVAHLFVVLYEEPALRRTFGESYDRYRATVPRWLARRSR